MSIRLKKCYKINATLFVKLNGTLLNRQKRMKHVVNSSSTKDFIRIKTLFRSFRNRNDSFHFFNRYLPHNSKFKCINIMVCSFKLYNQKFILFHTKQREFCVDREGKHKHSHTHDRKRTTQKIKTEIKPLEF